MGVAASWQRRQRWARASNAIPLRETALRLGPDGTGYIGIQAPIVNRVRELFVADVSRLLDQNAREIYVAMNSPGGVVNTAQDMIAFMDKTRAERGIRFTTHNLGLVGSAACYVFLAGQRRLSVPRSAFVFHEVSLVANGAIPSHNLQEASAKAQQIERTFLTMLTRKTKLTEAEASSFVRRTVLLNAEEALRDGVIDAVSPFVLPQGANIAQIRFVPNRTAARPAEPAAGR